ncbi:MAG: carAc [Alphaproteobacteria bacterium]|nr:carAc [Alphaproteobacteria bacterium]
MSGAPSEPSGSEARQKLFLMSADDIEEGGVARVEVEGVPPLAVYNVGGAFYATQDRCSHGNGDLSYGDLEGEEIICPYHGGAFNVVTGEPTRSPCGQPIRTYEVIVEGRNLYGLV